MGRTKNRKKKKPYKTRRRVVTEPITPTVPNEGKELQIGEKDIQIEEITYTKTNVPNQIPEHLISEASVVLTNLVPEKSSDRYHHYFSELEIWCQTEGVNIDLVEENIMLAYFGRLIKEKKYAISTLWTRLSAIRTILISKGIKIF